MKDRELISAATTPAEKSPPRNGRGFHVPISIRFWLASKNRNNDAQKNKQRMQFPHD